MKSWWKFPWSPMVKTWCFHCWSPDSIPGQGTKILQVVWPTWKLKAKNDFSFWSRSCAWGTGVILKFQLCVKLICFLKALFPVWLNLSYGTVCSKDSGRRIFLFYFVLFLKSILLKEVKIFTFHWAQLKQINRWMIISWSCLRMEASNWLGNTKQQIGKWTIHFLCNFIDSADLFSTCC